jgi:hypothetical protein
VRVLVAWEFQDRFSLSVHNSNDFVFTADGYQVAIVGPGCFASAISELIWRISENLFDLTIVDHKYIYINYSKFEFKK